jgi:hypothetical protein
MPVGYLSYRVMMASAPDDARNSCFRLFHFVDSPGFLRMASSVGSTWMFFERRGLEKHELETKRLCEVVIAISTACYDDVNVRTPARDRSNPSYSSAIQDSMPVVMSAKLEAFHHRCIADAISGPGISRCTASQRGRNVRAGAYKRDSMLLDSAMVEVTIAARSEGCLHGFSHLASLFSHTGQPKAVLKC